MSLIQEYLLNENNDNNTIYSSVDSSTGWISNTTTANASTNGPGGLVQNGLSFNGSNRQINFVGHPLSGLSKFSIVCFASLTNTGVSYPMIVAGDSAGVEIRMVGTTTRAEFAINGPITLSFSGATVSTGQYNMFAMTFDGSIVNGYSNKIISPLSIDTTGTPLTIAPNLRIGTREVGNFRYNGKIAKVQFYNHALSQDEISQIYDSTIPFLNTELTVLGNANISGSMTGNVGSWTDGSQSIRWYRNINETFDDALPIAGATGSTYSLQGSDIGYYIFMGVSGTNAMGSRQYRFGPVYAGGYVIGVAQPNNVQNNNISVSHGGSRANSYGRQDNAPPNPRVSDNRYRTRFNDYSYYTTHSGY